MGLNQEKAPANNAFDRSLIILGSVDMSARSRAYITLIAPCQEAFATHSTFFGVNISISYFHISVISYFKILVNGKG
jgi:hypothetical protein